MYPIDTNVLSELRKLRPHGAVLAWIASVEDAQLLLQPLPWVKFRPVLN
ncbi:hypothetical protein ACCUM_1711 [Candidatus Accumulibacter phosphatis]|uniref:Uncharacterized protein n=1 Tax=Candidatus Accumulibacter phosphatis TaxID=327160 RepID=A0A5S4EGI5_9PROT|nr:hypothetical protein ACCUM_1711 [Candidatus Accumulibacter phosphatis]